MYSLKTICQKAIRIEGRLLRIARLDADKYHFLDDPETLIAALRKCGERVDLFTFMQRLPGTTPKYPYPMEWDNLAAIPITTFDNWWTRQIGFKGRNKAKQAQKKGVIVREVCFDDALIRGICEIYNECPVRQGKRFPHYGKTLEMVRAEEATYLDSSTFIGAFLGNTLIGFVKLVTDETRKQANLMNIVSMIRHRDKAPTNSLIARAVEYCASHGISFLVYSNLAYGRRQRDGLSDFKERNGFRRVNVPRYYVPLTFVGRAAIRLRLHRRLVDYIPEPMGVQLRRLRAFWYKRKFQHMDALQEIG